MRTRKSTLTEQQRAAQGIGHTLDTQQNINTRLDHTAHSPAGNDYAVTPRTRARRASEAIRGQPASLAPPTATAASPAEVAVSCSHCDIGVVGRLKNSFIRINDDLFELSKPNSWDPTASSPPRTRQAEGDAVTLIEGLRDFTLNEVYACNNNKCTTYRKHNQLLFLTCYPIETKKTYRRRQRFFKLDNIELRCPENEAIVEPIVVEDRRPPERIEENADPATTSRDVVMETPPPPLPAPAPQAREQQQPPPPQEQQPDYERSPVQAIAPQKTAGPHQASQQSPREHSQPAPAHPPHSHPHAHSRATSSSGVKHYDEAYRSPHQRSREALASNGPHQSNGPPGGQVYMVTPAQFNMMMDANHRIQSQTNMNMAAIDQQRRDVQKLQRQQENWSHDVQRVDTAISRMAEEIRILQSVLDQVRADVREVRQRPAHAPQAPALAPTVDTTTLDLFAKSLEQMRPKLGEIEDLKIQMQIMKERIARRERPASAGPTPKPETPAHNPPPPQYNSPREPPMHILPRDVYHSVQPAPRVHTPSIRPEPRPEVRPLPSSAPAPPAPARDSPRTHHSLPHQQHHPHPHQQHQPHHHQQQSQAQPQQQQQQQQQHHAHSHPHPHSHSQSHQHQQQQSQHHRESQHHRDAQREPLQPHQAPHMLHRSQSSLGHAHSQPLIQSAHGPPQTQTQAPPAHQSPQSHHHAPSPRVHHRSQPLPPQTQAQAQVQSQHQPPPQPSSHVHAPSLPPMQPHTQAAPRPQPTHHEQPQLHPHPPQQSQPPQLQAHGYGHVASAEPRRPETEAPQPVPSQPTSASGWVTVNSSAKRGAPNGNDTHSEFLGHPHSPKRPKLAALEPRGEGNEPRPQVACDRMDIDEPGAQAHSRESYGDSSTQSRFIPYQSTHEHPGEDRWRTDPQRVVSHDHDIHSSPRRGGRGGGRGRGRKSLPSEFGPQWEKIEGPGGPVGPYGYYDSESPDVKGPPFGVRRDSNSNVIPPIPVHVSMDASTMQDPYAHTKKTRTKPIRNSDGILIRKDGRPDMRSQSSAANLRKVHARKEQERADGSVGDSPPSSGLAHHSMHASESPSPAAISEGADHHVHERHSQIMEKVFPHGRDEGSKSAERSFQRNGSPHGHKRSNGVKAEASNSETVSPSQFMNTESPAVRRAEKLEGFTAFQAASAKATERPQESGKAIAVPEKVADEPTASLPTPVAEPIGNESREVAASA